MVLVFVLGGGTHAKKGHQKTENRAPHVIAPGAKRSIRVRGTTWDKDRGAAAPGQTNYKTPNTWRIATNPATGEGERFI